MRLFSIVLAFTLAAGFDTYFIDGKARIAVMELLAAPSHSSQRFKALVGRLTWR
jgi:hypothetical protein